MLKKAITDKEEQIARWGLRDLWGKGRGDFWGCRKEGERFVGLSRVFLLLFFGEFCVFVCRVWVEGGGEESL